MTGSAVNVAVEWLPRAAVLVLLSALAFVTWLLSPVLITAFGGVVFAVAVRRIGSILARYLRVDARWCVAFVLLVLLAGVGFGLWRFGTQLTGQFQQLMNTVSASYESLAGWLQNHGFELRPPTLNASQLAWLTTMGTTAWHVLTGTLLVAFLVAYLSLTPSVYRRGAILMFPKHLHRRAGEVLDGIETALWRWTLGQLLAMATVGTLTGVSLWLLGVPSAALLGLIAGLLEFVPIVGPLIAAVPAVLVAASVSPQTALWALLIYAAIQQAESWIITPLAERSLVALPPAVTLLAIASFSLLFGIPGLVFATPLALVVMVSIRMLYVGDLLDEELGESRMPK